VDSILLDKAADALPLWLVTEKGFPTWAKAQPDAVAAWCRASAFTGTPGQVLVLPGAGGALLGAVAGVPPQTDIWAFAHLPGALPKRAWKLATALKPHAATRAALGFALGTYAFARYRKAPTPGATLLWPRGADRDEARRLHRATVMVRDLVNTPAGDLGPAELADAALALAKRHGARASIITGDDLLTQNYPMVHAVGRAATRPPCLVDLRWGKANAPKVTLVGKGVVFDSGGLDIKPAGAMQIMKKDMGGAATVLGLADLIMDAKLPVRLRVLVPAVENAIAGNAFRPMDILKSRAGLTVEIGNTDAEGRLILADALTEAVSEDPDLLLDCATLTGAARVALGPDLPALYTDDEALAADLLRHGVAESDPMWRLPLYAPYRERFTSRLADLNNTGDDAMAGSITAALFLKEFAGKARSWAHLDLYAWNQKPRPGRPAGGEAQTIRAWFAFLKERYAA